MKKKVLGLIMVAFVAFLPVFVKAEEIAVTSEEALATCLNTKDATCSLSEDVEVLTTIRFNNETQAILDLNGHKLTGPDDGAANWYAIVVEGGTLTLKDTSENQTGELYAKCYGIETKAGTLVMESGKITATKNGTIGAAIVNYGGKTEIKGGTLLASNWALNAQAYFSDVEVVISGGTFETTSTEEAAVQVGGEYSVKSETVTIKGGTFKGETAFSVDSDATVTLTGGEFSSDVSAFLPAQDETNKYASYLIETPEGEKYVVATEEDVEETTYVKDAITDKEKVEEVVNSLDNTIKNLEEAINNSADDEEKAELTKAKEALVKVQELLKNKNVASMYEIVYGDVLGENFVKDTEVTEQLDSAVKVTLDIPETLEKVKEGYTRTYYVVRLHGDYEVTELEATDNGDGTVTFETDRFSTYVLTYTDAKTEMPPKTFDGSVLYMVVGIIALVGLVSVALYSKKAKNY